MVHAALHAHHTIFTTLMMADHGWRRLCRVVDKVCTYCCGEPSLRDDAI